MPFTASTYVTHLRLPRRTSRVMSVTLGLILPAIATVAIPNENALLGGGIASIALIGILAWLGARAVFEPNHPIGIALATSLAVGLFAPVAVSLAVPALLGIAWVIRTRPPIAANDNPVMERALEFSWVPARRPHDIEAVQTLG